MVFKSSTKLGMKTLLLLLTLSLPLVSPQCGGLLCSDGRWLSWGPERVCWCYPVGRVCCTDTPSSCAPAPQDCGVGGPYPPLLPLPSFPPLLPSLPLRGGRNQDVLPLIKSLCLKAETTWKYEFLYLLVRNSCYPSHRSHEKPGARKSVRVSSGGR